MKRAAIYLLVLMLANSLSFSNSFDNDEYSKKEQELLNSNNLNYQMRILEPSCRPPEIVNPPIYIGPIFGFTRNTLLGSIEPNRTIADMTSIFPSIGNGYNAGLSYEKWFGEPSNSCSSILFSLKYNDIELKTEESFRPFASYNIKMLDLKGRESDSNFSSMNYKNDVSISWLSFDILFKLYLMDNLGIVIGPSFDVNLSNNMKETLSLDNSDQTLKFKNQEGVLIDETGRSCIIFNDKIPDYNSFQFVLKFGIQYDLFINNNFYISPYIIYGFSFTNFVSNSITKLSNLNLGVAIHFAL